MIATMHFEKHVDHDLETLGKSPQDCSEERPTRSELIVSHRPTGKYDTNRVSPSCTFKQGA